MSRVDPKMRYRTPVSWIRHRRQTDSGPELARPRLPRW